MSNPNFGASAGSGAKRNTRFDQEARRVIREFDPPRPVKIALFAIFAAIIVGLAVLVVAFAKGEQTRERRSRKRKVRRRRLAYGEAPRSSRPHTAKF